MIVPREQLDRVLHFYRDVVGMQEFWRYEPKPGDLRLIKLLVRGQRRHIIELMIHSAPLTRASIGSMEDIWAFNLLDPDGTRIEVQDLTKFRWPL